MKKRNFHVIPSNEGVWAVRREGNTRVSSLHNTQREAIEAARQIAKEHMAEILIHDKTGRIRERNSYGSDRMPPRESRPILLPETISRVRDGEIRQAIDSIIRRKNNVDGKA